MQMYQEMLQSYTNQLAAEIKKVNDKIDKKLFNNNLLQKVFPAFVVKNKELFQDSDQVLKLCEETKGISVLFDFYFRARDYNINGTKKGSVAYRVVQENFPIFAKNLEKCEKLCHAERGIAETFQNGMELHFAGMLTPDQYTQYMTQRGINQYNQALNNNQEAYTLNNLIRDINNQNANKGRFYQKLVKLQKQILSDEKTEFLLTGFADDQEFAASILEFKDNIENTGVAQKMIKLFSRFDYMNVSNIYISNKQLSFFSHALTRTYDLFDEYVIRDCERQVLDEKMATTKKKRSLSKADVTKAKSMAKKRLISIQDIDRYMADAAQMGSITACKYKNVESYLLDTVMKIVTSYEAAKQAFDAQDITVDNFVNTESNRGIIKTYLDAVLEMHRFVNRFKMPSIPAEIEVEIRFYDALEDILTHLQDVNNTYNKVRNYLTKKPKDIAKKSETCLGKTGLFVQGWHTSDVTQFKKEEQCILRRNGIYYYATLSNNAPVRTKIPTSVTLPKEDYYEKINMKTLADPSKNIPRCIFSKAVKTYFEAGNTEDYIRSDGVMKPITYTKNIYDIYKNKTFITGYYNKEKDPLVKEKKYAEFKASLEQLITFYIDFLQVYHVTKDYELSALKSASEYSNVYEFYTDCEMCFAQTSIGYVSKDVLDELVNTGALYLFEIRNKDLYKDGSKHIYTRCFHFLFSEENMQKKCMKLNGKPKIYYRPAAIDRYITHPKGSMIVNKIDKQENFIPQDIHRELYLYANNRIPSISSKATAYEHLAVIKPAFMDLIKDNRYTQEQYTLEICVTLNFDAISTVHKKSLNECVNARLKKGECNILAVTRGERDLLYYTIMDTKKTIIKEGNLNVINGFNYQKKLQNLTYERRKDSQTWKNPKKIATIKEGYLQGAISQIIDMALEYDAVICIEALSDQYKEKRASVDNQVYKKFESLLIRRLACFYKATIDPTAPGGVANPLQLADPQKTEALQNGILFKVQAAYTSNMCPETGFSNLFDLNRCKTVQAKTEFLSSFDDIYFDYGRGCFVFRFNYDNFSNLKTTPARKEWILNTSGERTRYNANQNRMEPLSITDELAACLQDYKIPFANAQSLLDIVKDENVNGKVVAAIMNAFEETLKCKIYPLNSDEEAYFYSAAEDVDGNNFDSRAGKENMPLCAEGVKAYHLGEKMVMILSRCSVLEEDARINPTIKNTEWLAYKQA